MYVLRKERGVTFGKEIRYSHGFTRDDVPAAKSNYSMSASIISLTAMSVYY